MPMLASYLVFFTAALEVPTAPKLNPVSVVSTRASTITNNYEVKDRLRTDLDKNSLCLW